MIDEPLQVVKHHALQSKKIIDSGVCYYDYLTYKLESKITIIPKSDENLKRKVPNQMANSKAQRLSYSWLDTFLIRATMSLFDWRDWVSHLPEQQLSRRPAYSWRISSSTDTLELPGKLIFLNESEYLWFHIIVIVHWL